MNTYLLSVVVAVFLVSACQTDNNNDKNTVDNEVLNHNETEKQLAKIPKYKQQCYHHLKGILGDMNITVDLLEGQPLEATRTHLSGYYRYDKYGGPIALNGYYDKNGKLELSEQGTLGAYTHTIVGEWTSKGFTGEWVSGDSDRHFPVVLERVDTNIQQLSCHYFEDSIRGIPQLKLSPQASFSAHWFELETDNKTAKAFMRKAIQQEMGSDFKFSNNHKVFVDQQKEWFFKEYLAEMQSFVDDGIIDTVDVSGEYFSMNYDQSYSMNVYYNEGDTLTLGSTFYTYTGGAHGIYGTSVASYDLKKCKQITLDDVLKEGYEEAVSEALANAVRIKFELGEDASLAEVLFDEAIAPNDNFGITDKGIFFVFSPYEIASYAVGEIELFVAFDRITEYVK